MCNTYYFLCDKYCAKLSHPLFYRVSEQIYFGDEETKWGSRRSDLLKSKFNERFGIWTQAIWFQSPHSWLAGDMLGLELPMFKEVCYLSSLPLYLQRAPPNSTRACSSGHYSELITGVFYYANIWLGVDRYIFHFRLMFRETKSQS